MVTTDNKLESMTDQELYELRGKSFQAMKEFAESDQGNQRSNEQIAAYDRAEKEHDQIAAILEARQATMDRKKRFEALEGVRDEDEHFRRKNEFRSDRQPTHTDEEYAMLGFMRAQYRMDPGKRAQEAAHLLGLDLFNVNTLKYRALPKNIFRHLQRQTAEGLFPEVDPDDIRRKYRDTGDTSGHGQMISPGVMMAFSRARLQFGSVYRWAHVVSRAEGHPLHWPTLDDTVPNPNAGIIAEGAASREDTEVDTSELVLGSYKYSSGVLKMTSEVLQDSSAINWMAEMPGILGGHIGRLTDPDFTTGSGTGEPQGVVTGTTVTHTAAAAGAISSTDLIRLQGALDDWWEPMAAFYCNKATRTEIRLLALTDGQFLWQPGLQAGVPDRLLGDPIRVIHGMADIGASAKSMLYGDLREQYKIGDVGPSRFHRIDEKYLVEEDKVGFLSFVRTDGGVLVRGGNPPMIALEHPAS